MSITRIQAGMLGTGSVLLNNLATTGIASTATVLNGAMEWVPAGTGAITNQSLFTTSSVRFNSVEFPDNTTQTTAWVGYIPATTSTLGAIKVGANLSIAGDGTLSGLSPYQLPIATTTTLGGVVVGAGLSINTTTGVLSTVDMEYINSLVNGTGTQAVVLNGTATINLLPGNTTTIGGVKQLASQAAITIDPDGSRELKLNAANNTGTTGHLV